MLQNRLDKYPVGAPPAPSLYEILKLVFSEEEAALGAQMPLQLTTLSTLSRITGKKERTLRDLLEGMAQKGVVFDTEHEGELYYMLSPTMVGFFEMVFVRRRQDLPQKKIAHLLHEYYLDDGGFVHEVFQDGTPLGRTLMHETSIPETELHHALTHERASELIGEATFHALSICTCRHVMEHLDRRCTFPLDVCTSLGRAAEFMVRRGLGRRVEKEEALAVLEETRDMGLIHIGDNVKERPAFICHCCPCCCGMLYAIHSLKIHNAIVTSPYEPVSDPERCVACGQCAKQCPVHAIEIEPHGAETRQAHIDEALCLGCGICESSCPKQAISMERRKERIITPLNTFERVLSMSLERGKLQNFLFEDPRSPSVRFLQTLIGAFLRLSPVKRLLLAESVRSKMLRTLADRLKGQGQGWMFEV
jgi:Pyruvate/2-oxoacid:ferredoxin oxidoreductase delta subunit